LAELGSSSASARKFNQRSESQGARLFFFENDKQARSIDAEVRREGRERRLRDLGKILAMTIASPEAGVPAGRMPHRENAGGSRYTR